jgi:hypothetical protein
MNKFGHHGTGAGYHGCHQFCNGYRQVGTQSKKYTFYRISSMGHKWLSPFSLDVS